MKRYFILVLMILLLPNKVMAGCESGESLRIQKLVNNITTSYEYNKEVGAFTLTFTNLSDEFVIVDINEEQEYTANYELTIPNVKSGNHTYYIYTSKKNCFDSEVAVRNINLPYYNKFYDLDECKSINNKFCYKWLPNKLDYRTWKKNIDNYKSKKKAEEEKIAQQNKQTIVDKIRDVIIALYVDYYYIFLPITIFALVAIIYLKNKSEQLI